MRRAKVYMTPTDVDCSPATITIELIEKATTREFVDSLISRCSSCGPGKAGSEPIVVASSTLLAF